MSYKCQSEYWEDYCEEARISPEVDEMISEKLEAAKKFKNVMAYFLGLPMTDGYMMEDLEDLMNDLLFYFEIKEYPHQHQVPVIEFLQKKMLEGLKKAPPPPYGYDEIFKDLQ